MNGEIDGTMQDWPDYPDESEDAIPSRVVETDNFGGDYPDEKFVTGILPKAECIKIADEMNDKAGPNSFRFWKVEKDDYILQPGFEP